MRTRTRLLVVTAAALLAGVTVWAQQGPGDRRAQPPLRQRGASTQPAGPMAEMCQMHMKMMADLKDTLAQAKQAADAGDSKAAAQKIGEAQQLIEQQHARMHERMKGRMGQAMRGAGEGGAMKCPVCGKTMGPDKGEVSNRTCPMDNSKIDPAKLTAGATREYAGEKIGFCCAGCAQQWDRLSEDQKRTKMETTQRQTEGDATTGR